ncbi:MAG: hypothetical protein WBW76_00360 [Candidatus Cybelea sp.]
MSDRLVWLTLFLLGCYHGLNPGMGWLFAAGLGFQDRSAAAVLRAIVPLALGHVISVALIVLITIYVAAQIPHRAVHFAAAAILIGFGVYRLVRARHVRWVGMRVGFSGLTLWGFLMSSAHGAGLMLLPFVMAGRAQAESGMAMPMPRIHPAPGTLFTGWLMVGVHTLGYVLTATAIALLVYTKIGVRFLRTGWINMDLVWAAALILTGLISLVT